ncbi:MAG: VWA domain-containing protein, partial [Muribaculaceae bacterium]|nr:VWA domain-containing protein [Muribaculaceae bacterium]
VCECVNLFCVGESDYNKSPLCGVHGTLEQADEYGINVARGLG